MAEAPKLPANVSQAEFDGLAGSLMDRIESDGFPVELHDDNFDRVIVYLEDIDGELIPLLFAKECREWSTVLRVYYFDFGDDVLLLTLEPTEPVQVFFASLQARAWKRAEEIVSEKRLRGFDTLRGWQ